MGLLSADESMLQVFKQIAEVEVADDGLEYLSGTVRVEPIRKTSLNAGVRVHMTVQLGQMRIPLQVDIGLGDSLVPAPVSCPFPPLLDGAVPEVLCYPRELVIAEKLEAIIKLSSENTRMKDFFDIWFLFTMFKIDSVLLAEAIQRTFHRRGTTVPVSRPLSFTPEFTQSTAKIVQWNAFLKKANLTAHAPELSKLGDEIWTFLEPVLQGPNRTWLDKKLPTA